MICLYYPNPCYCSAIILQFHVNDNDCFCVLYFTHKQPSSAFFLSDEPCVAKSAIFGKLFIPASAQILSASSYDLNLYVIFYRLN